MPWFKSKISIHAPRGGSDNGLVFSQIPITDFNPRSPRGERPGRLRLYADNGGFQSTLPAGGATSATIKSNIANSIFQSTLPAGGATVQSKHAAMTV